MNDKPLPQQQQQHRGMMISTGLLGHGGGVGNSSFGMQGIMAAGPGQQQLLPQDLSAMVGDGGTISGAGGVNNPDERGRMIMNDQGAGAAAAPDHQRRSGASSSHTVGAAAPTATNNNNNSSSQQPPSRYESQKRRDWNTFGQYLKNHRPPLNLARCSGAHVLEFLRYLDQFGKTKVHGMGCPFFGQPHPSGPCGCPLRQAWGSLDALIGRLRAAFEEHGGKPESNPFGAKAVRLYLREVRDMQAKARGIAYEKKKRKRPTALPGPAAAHAHGPPGAAGASSSSSSSSSSSTLIQLAPISAANSGAPPPPPLPNLDLHNPHPNHFVNADPASSNPTCAASSSIPPSLARQSTTAAISSYHASAAAATTRSSSPANTSLLIGPQSMSLHIQQAPGAHLAYHHHQAHQHQQHHRALLQQAAAAAAAHHGLPHQQSAQLHQLQQQSHQLALQQQQQHHEPSSSMNINPSVNHDPASSLLNMPRRN